MSGTCPTKIKFLCISAVVFLAAAAEAAPPPGAPGHPEYRAETALSGGLYIGYGYYAPSLKMLNSELENFGMTSMEERSYYAAGGVMKRRQEKLNMLITGSYWRGVSEEASGIGESEYRLHLISFCIPLLFEFGIIEEQLYLGAGLSTRSNFAILKNEQSSDIHYSASSGSLSWGPALTLEYYPFPEAGNFSLFLYAEKIMLNLIFSKLTVDTSTRPGYEPGDTIVTSDGKDLDIELDGPVITVGANFYF
jgi:hypothetical protein